MDERMSLNETVSFASKEKFKLPSSHVDTTCSAWIVHCASVERQNHLVLCAINRQLRQSVSFLEDGVDSRKICRAEDPRSDTPIDDQVS